MRSTIIASILALAASVTSLKITFPTSQNASLDLSVDNIITWETVTSDPASIRIELVNNVVHPPFALVVAPSVNTADLKYTLKPQSNVTTGTAFQINFVGTSGQNTGIVAQSPQFTVAKVALSTTTASPTEGAGAASATASGAPAATTSGSAAGSVQVPAWAGAGAGVLAVGVAALLL